MHDTLRFLSKLHLSKIWNIGLLWLSYQLSKIFLIDQPWGLPMTLSIEPTTACNLRCPECPSGLRSFTRPTGTLSSDLFDRILSDQHRTLTYLIFYFQGEPYIHPSFLDMVARAHQKGIYTITSTNGHFLNDALAERTVKSGLDRLIISVDGTTQEVYEQYRKGGKLDHVLQGARNVIAWKKKLGSRSPHVIFQFLVVRPNEHQITDIKRLATELGVDEVKYKTAQLYDYRYGHELMPQDPSFRRYQLNQDGTYELAYTVEDRCWKLWHASVITWDGKVLPCCFDKDATHELGDISHATSFETIWRSKAYRSFRRRLRENGRSDIDICANCSEGCKVWA